MDERAFEAMRPPIRATSLNMPPKPDDNAGKRRGCLDISRQGRRVRVSRKARTPMHPRREHPTVHARPFMRHPTACAALYIVALIAGPVLAQTGIAVERS